MSKKSFVITPFNTKFDGIWQHCIKPAVESLGHLIIRGDDIFKPGSIITDIVQSISDADYIIADLSDPNPNVYYELGFSHALNKPVILITQDLSSLPFDLRHQRVIKYDDTASGAVTLKNTLQTYINNL